MKKIILILLVFISLTGYSQQINFDYGKKTTLTTYTMDADTSYIIGLQNQYYYSLQFVWASLDTTNAYALVQVSQDGTNYSDISTDTLFFNSASSNGYIRNLTVGTGERYFKINIESGDCSSGTLKLYGNFMIKR